MHIFKLTSSPCWWVRFFSDELGKEVRRSTGYRRDEYSIEMVRRIINIESGDPTSIVFSVSWFKNQILELLELEGISERSIPGYEKAFEYLTQIYGEDFDIKKLKRDCALEIQKFLHEKGIANSTINRYVGLLNASFERLIENDKILINPLHKYKKLSVKNDKKKVPTREQMKKFMFYVNQIKNEKLRHLIRIYAYTGIRRSELLNVERDDVDLDNMNFQAVNSKSKDKHKVKRGFIEAVWNDFRFFLERSNSKFPFKIYSESRLTYLVTRCMREAGLPKDFHLHTLRHAFITFAIEDGTPIRDVQHYVDHGKMSTTEGYAHDRSERIPKINIE